MKLGKYIRHRHFKGQSCPCIVPFCDSWTTRCRDDGTIWFCSRHWKHIPLKWRRHWNAAHKDENWVLFEKLTAFLVGLCISASWTDRKVKFWEMKS